MPWRAAAAATRALVGTSTRTDSDTVLAFGLGAGLPLSFATLMPPKGVTQGPSCSAGHEGPCSLSEGGTHELACLRACLAGLLGNRGATGRPIHARPGPI